MHDAQTLIRSLSSELCPACGGKKKRRQTLCLKDYRALPAELRNRLFDRVGDGYERAVQNALIFLEVETPSFPSIEADRSGLPKVHYGSELKVGRRVQDGEGKVGKISRLEVGRDKCEVVYPDGTKKLWHPSALS